MRFAAGQASIDAVRAPAWCHPEWPAALTASYAGSPHPTCPARPRC